MSHFFSVLWDGGWEWGEVPSGETLMPFSEDRVTSSLEWVSSVTWEDSVGERVAISAVERVSTTPDSSHVCSTVLGEGAALRSGWVIEEW